MAIRYGTSRPAGNIVNGATLSLSRKSGRRGRNPHFGKPDLCDRLWLIRDFTLFGSRMGLALDELLPV